MSTKTITMKIDLNSSDESVQQIRKLLRGLNGVDSSIDVENGLVIVCGGIDHPEEIIDKIRKCVKSVTMFSVHEDGDDVLPQAQKPKKRVHFADNVFEPTSTRPTTQHGSHSKVRGHGSEHFRAKNGDKNCYHKQQDGIHDQRHSGQRAYTAEAKRVFFSDMPRQYFDSMRKDYKHCAEMMRNHHHQIAQTMRHHHHQTAQMMRHHHHQIAQTMRHHHHQTAQIMRHFHCQIYQQQCEFSHVKIRLSHSCNSPAGCWIM